MRTFYLEDGRSKTCTHHVYVKLALYSEQVAFVTGNLKLRLHVEQNSETRQVGITDSADSDAALYTAETAFID